jgi:hypothetical protein
VNRGTCRHAFQVVAGSYFGLLTAALAIHLIYASRDRDKIFGKQFLNQVKAQGIKQVLSAARSPWQRAYVERLIGQPTRVPGSCDRARREIVCTRTFRRMPIITHRCALI